MIAPAFHIRDDDFQSLVDDPIDAVVDDEQAEVEVGRIGQGATEQPPAAITGEHEGVEARVSKLCSNAKPEASAHRRPIVGRDGRRLRDRKSTRLNSSHSQISYAVFCLKKKKETADIRVRLLETHGDGRN